MKRSIVCLDAIPPGSIVVFQNPLDTFRRGVTIFCQAVLSHNKNSGTAASNHVAISLGGSTIIESSRSKGGLHISQLTSLPGSIYVYVPLDKNVAYEVAKKAKEIINKRDYKYSISSCISSLFSRSKTDVESVENLDSKTGFMCSEFVIQAYNEVCPNILSEDSDKVINPLTTPKNLKALLNVSPNFKCCKVELREEVEMQELGAGTRPGSI